MQLRIPTLRLNIVTTTSIYICMYIYIYTNMNICYSYTHIDTDDYTCACAYIYVYKYVWSHSLCHPYLHSHMQSMVFGDAEALNPKAMVCLHHGLPVQS